MAFDAFLKIEGIEGDSQQKGHPGEIEVASFSWGETSSGDPARGGGAGTGKVQMQDFEDALTTSSYRFAPDPVIAARQACRRGNARRIPAVSRHEARPHGRTRGTVPATVSVKRCRWPRFLTRCAARQARR